jgi:hypothetical protein
MSETTMAGVFMQDDGRTYLVAAFLTAFLRGSLALLLCVF